MVVLLGTVAVVLRVLGEITTGQLLSFGLILVVSTIIAAIIYGDLD